MSRLLLDQIDSAPVREGRPRLFAMVTTRSSRDYTPHAVRTFFETTPLRPVDRLVLISNDDPDAAEELRGYPQCEVRLNPEPRGFAANANRCIDEALARGADLFFMNNDIIFSDEWLPPLLGADDAILVPLSNREVGYAASVVVMQTKHVAGTLVLQAPMELRQYLQAPRMFEAIVEMHRRGGYGSNSLIVIPFYCVRLPLPILQAVGKFDERFGRAGGEDYDYALRAWLAGFELKLVLGSYLLHFWGKSTIYAKDSGPTTYDRGFLQIFKDKWGVPLYRFVLEESTDIIAAIPGVAPALETKNFAEVIRLAQRQPVPVFLP